MSFHAVDWFTVGGSLASASAIGVSIWVFWSQTKRELNREKKERNDEFSALKKIINAKTVLLKYQMDLNKSAFQIICDNPNKHFVLNKFDDSYYIHVPTDNGVSFAEKVYRLKIDLDGHIVNVAKYDMELVNSLIVLAEVTNNANDATFAVLEHVDKSSSEKIIKQIEQTIGNFKSVEDAIDEIDSMTTVE